MRNFVKKYIPEDSWSLSYDSFDRNAQGVRESQFTLGNGFIGSRGILEEVPYDAHAGTYIAGVYDKIGSKVADLVNVPNPINIKISVNGEKLDASIMPVLKHQRQLNMRHGLLLRRTLYETVHKNKLDYQSIRFFGMKDKSLVMMRVYVTPVTKPCTITIEAELNISVSNVSGLSEGRKRHFRIKDVDTSESKIISYLSAETLGSKISIAYAHAMRISIGGKNWFSNEQHLLLRLEKKQTAVFTKIYSIHTKRRSEVFDLKKRAVRTLQEYMRKGFDNLITAHSKEWEHVWEKSDIVVGGNPGIQQSLRFNIYHLAIAGIDNGGESNIGAKTLSGEGYRGHIFWDSEIFIVPFFLFTNPRIARSLLLYRIKRMNKAKKIAASHGYKGAMFPWESADTGYEETPTWARNLDGSVIRIRTNEFEHHITADVAYAVFQYYVATGDEKFMLQYGYELLFETARFWASRVKFNKRKKKFEIKEVIGPDEFHVKVNNNAFTNMIARWNIFCAYGMFLKMRRKYPLIHKSLIAKIGMSPVEVKKWELIIDKMYVCIRKDKVIEQFDGFFKLKKARITEFDSYSMPEIPRNIKLKEIGDFQIIKQADVVMLLYLLADSFDKKTKRVNYDFYAPRTVHKSSLSPSIHSVVAAELGYTQQAFRYFMLALNTDRYNHHGNTGAGIHAANLGGIWLAVINGIAGMRITKGTLSFTPRIPRELKSLAFSICWKGLCLKIFVKNKRVRVTCPSRQENDKHCLMRGSKKNEVKIKIHGRIYSIAPGKTVSVKKR